ncbi:FAD-dependent oxidoreductase [Rhodospirillaceae bacterium SYSU D60014]|uniref:NAD(P)/FAD-dependent oxidoreductase n=1 Tax=Virgifigura deserti TaxID=2268457 RepID=UPI000E666392
MKIVIVGGGIAGLSTAWALSRDGHQITLFEQDSVPNPRGASVDQHRLIRNFYSDQVGYCRLVASAFAAWDQLWRALGRSHYIETGALAISTTPDDWTARSRRTMDTVGFDYTVLDDATLAARYPILTPAAGCWALHTKRGGVLLADRIVADLGDLLRREGVDIRVGCRVRDIDPARARITLEDGTTAAGDAVVIAAGAWLPRLLAEFAGRVTPMRNAVLYADPPQDLAAAWAGAPIIVDFGGEDDAYAAPPVAGCGLKLAYGAHRAAGDVEAPREPWPDEAAAVLGRFAGRLRNLPDYSAQQMRICFYTIAPESRFILERLEQAWIVSACSGHGFKFGALVGHATAAAVTGRYGTPQTARWLAGLGPAPDAASDLILA